MAFKSIEDSSRIIEKVVPCAGKLFRKYGYKNTTVDDIAHGIHISKKTLYDVFPSKENILSETIWREKKEVLIRFYDTIPSESQPDTILLLFCLFIFTDRVERSENGYFWALYFDDYYINKAEIDAIKRVVKTIYFEGYQNGIFKPINPIFATEVIVSIITAAIKSFQLKEDPSMFNEALSMIADSISYKKRLKFGGLKKDYYKILGISRNAVPDEIKKVYRKMALKYHPDLTKGDMELERKFKESQEAYKVLIDPEKKSAYDHFLKVPFSGDSDRYKWDDFSYAIDMG